MAHGRRRKPRSRRFQPIRDVEVRHRGREQQQARRENGRDNPGRIHAQRQVRGLAAIHLPPNLALGVLDGNAPLGTFHEDDANEHRNHQNHEGKSDEQAHVAQLDELEGLHQSTGNAHNDT